MFETIVWATDGSEAADQALPYLRQLADTRDTHIVVCHSVLAMLGPGAHGVALPADAEAVGAKIDRQVDELIAAGFDATLRMVNGDTVHGAAHDIRRVAEEQDADLIVTGSNGHTALGGLVLGSVTQRLVHLAGCPVLVVPPRKEDEARARGAHAVPAHA